MPKVSIYLNNNFRLILKNIIEFKMNNILYKKSDYIEVISFYRLILHNTSSINYIKFKNREYINNNKSNIAIYEVFLKNLKYHNTDGLSYIRHTNNDFDDGFYSFYHINGIRLTYNDWMKNKHVRLSKIKKLIYKLNDN